MQHGAIHRRAQSGALCMAELRRALLAVLQQFEGVEAASLSADRSTVYIKARQQGFDEAAAKQIILGGNHVE